LEVTEKKSIPLRMSDQAQGKTMHTSSRRAACAAIMILISGAADAATYTVTSAADAGANTLRWAIQQANTNANSDIITFNVGGGGARNIALSTPLPAITSPVTIDATTQPGYAGTPLIQLDGLNAGAGAIGLQLSSSASTLRGFAVMRFNGGGIRIDGASGGNTVAACHVGLNNGGAAAGNSGTGVFIAGSPNNMIGPGNTISGNGVDGVRIDAAAATGNVVQGNRIGTNPGGDAAIANGFNGVVITAANSNRIGGTTGTELNVISGNSKNGIGIGGGASSNVIERNYIGLAADGASALGNGEDGVLVSDSPSNKIGGDVAGTYNIISANGWHGVELRGDGAGANVVQRSILGSDLFGTLDRGNGRAGVYLTSTIGGGGANGNSIGGGAWGAGGNLISGNGWAGVHIERAYATVIRGNRIGTDVNGVTALPNQSGGIDINVGGESIIGTTTAGNLISGNASTGIDILTDSVVQIVGNRVGTTADGSAALANSGRGIWLRDSWAGGMIGGADHDPWTCNRACNLISGNTGYGLQIGTVNYLSHEIRGNFIGTNLAGNAALPNMGGIYIQTDANVGGAGSGDGNLISGNIGHGVQAAGGLLSVQANRIGTTATGMAALGNQGDGIRIGPNRASIYIGGVGAGNVIAGNTGHGIQSIEDDPFMSANQEVQANYIGLGADGITCIGNAGDGIRFGAGARSIDVGGTSAGMGNRIGCNGGDGIVLLGSAARYMLLGNLFRDNGEMAIDIDDDGVTANDPDDNDIWRTNFPTLASAVNTAGVTRISGSLAAAAATNYRIEFFDNSTCDGSGHGEGQSLIGNASHSTDASGNTAFSIDVAALAAGRKITATATSVEGTEPSISYSTSEFSACVTVVTPPPAPTASNNGPICNGQNLQLNASTISGVSYAWTGPNGFASTQQNPSITGATTAATGLYSVTATIGGSTGAAGTTTATVNACQISINDPAAVSEGTGSNSTASFVVSLNHASKLPITLNWLSVNGTASSPADYTHGGGTLTIPANATSASITRPVIGDALDEDNENFHIDLSNASAGSISDARGTIVINDDDAAPTLSFDAGGCSVIEGDGGAVNCAFLLRLSAASGKTVAFNTSTANGTATAGSDYTGHASTARNITTGLTTLTINVPVLADTLEEVDETFALNVTGVTNASPGSITGHGTILDDDLAELVFFDGFE